MDLNLNLNSLEISKGDSELAPSDKEPPGKNSKGRPRRSLRPKKVVESSGVIVHRTLNKPKKLTPSSSLTDIKDYYMCRKIKRLPSTLETIFEEPKQIKADVQYMSLKKFKRVLDFPNNDSGSQKLTKRKKRLLKVKKITSQHRINNKKKVALEMLHNKLVDLDTENENQN